MHLSRLAVNFTFLVNGFIYANWIARLPRFQEIYSLSNSTTGLVLLVMAIGALIAMPFTGWLIVKNGSRKITMVASVLLCLFAPILPILGTIEKVIPLFFVLGMLTGIMDVAMNAQAVLIEQKYERPLMSSFHAVFSGGMMLGAGSAALFSKYDISLFHHILIISLIALLFILWSVRYYLSEDKIASTEGTAFQLPAKSLISIGTIAFCCMMGEGAMQDWSANYMINIANSSASLAPIALGSFSLAMMLGRIFGDRGREIYGDKHLLIVNSLIAFTGLVLLLLFPNPYAVIFACFITGLGLSVIVPIAYSTAGSMKDVAPGVGISMVTTIGYAGFLFGPPIIGYLADWQTLRMAMHFVGVLFGVMTILSFRHKME